MSLWQAGTRRDDTSSLWQAGTRSDDMSSLRQVGTHRDNTVYYCLQCLSVVR